MMRYLTLLLVFATFSTSAFAETIVRWQCKNPPIVDGLDCYKSGKIRLAGVNCTVKSTSKPTDCKMPAKGEAWQCAVETLECSSAKNCGQGFEKRELSDDDQYFFNQESFCFRNASVDPNPPEPKSSQDPARK